MKLKVKRHFHNERHSNPIYIQRLLSKISSSPVTSEQSCQGLRQNFQISKIRSKSYVISPNEMSSARTYNHIRQMFKDFMNAFKDFKDGFKVPWSNPGLISPCEKCIKHINL